MAKFLRSFRCDGGRGRLPSSGPLNVAIALFVLDVVLNSTEFEGSKLGIGMEWVGLTMLFGHLGVPGSPG